MFDFSGLSHSILHNCKTPQENIETIALQQQQTVHYIVMKLKLPKFKNICVKKVLCDKECFV